MTLVCAIKQQQSAYCKQQQYTVKQQQYAYCEQQQCTMKQQRYACCEQQQCTMKQQRYACCEQQQYTVKQQQYAYCEATAVYKLLSVWVGRQKTKQSDFPICWRLHFIWNLPKPPYFERQNWITFYFPVQLKRKALQYEAISIVCNMT